MTKLAISPDLQLPLDTVTSTLVVYGGKGMGKTNLGSVLMEELAAAQLKFSVIDPMGVWWGLRHGKSGKGKGIEVLILGGIHGDIPIEPTAGAIVADLVVDEHVNVVIDISRRPDGSMWAIGERIRFVRDYSRRLYQRQGERRRPMMQVYDEAARFIPQIVRKDEADLAACMGAIAVLVEEGRNVGVGVGLITQRSARLNKDVAELADCMIAFRTPGPNSRRAVLDWLGEHVEKERLRDMDMQVRKLPIGSALVVSPGWLDVETVVKFRPRQTFDSSKTPKPGEQETRVVGTGAKPDLGKYRVRMAETIEKAKADNPKELRRRIEELEKQLTVVHGVKANKSEPAKAQGKPEDRATIRSLRRALEEAMKFIVTVSAKKFDVPGVDKAELEKAVTAAVDRAAQIVSGRLEARERELERLKNQATQLVVALKKALATPDMELAIEVTKNDPFTVLPGAGARHDVSTRVHTQDHTAESGASNLGKDSRRRILTVLAQHPNGKPIKTLAALAVYTVNGYFKNQLSALRTAGHVTGSHGEPIKITAAGLAALGDYDPLPTGDALRKYWVGRLNEAQGKILKALFDQYPQGLQVTDLAAAANYTVNGYFKNMLSSLRTMGLVEGKGHAPIKAAASLYEE